MKKLICSFTGEVKRKQESHIDLIDELGYTLDIFVNSGLEQGKQHVKYEKNIHLLQEGFFRRSRQVYSYYKSNKKLISHVELYGGGRFVFVYVLLAKLFGIKILLIERGGLNQYIRKDTKMYLTKFSNYLLYKYADVCWYKEYYMLPYLKKYGVKNLHFIPNSIGQFDFNKENFSFEDRKIDYLWVNNIIPERHIDWVINISQMKEFKSKLFHIRGFGLDEYAQNKYKEIKDMGLSNVEVFLYDEDILRHYRNSKYFLLPADYVFGNNSLLESMARGMVPILTNVSGVDKLVRHKTNGLSGTNTYDGYLDVMKKSLDYESASWNSLSTAAINKVVNEYSLGVFNERLTNLYQFIGKS